MTHFSISSPGSSPNGGDLFGRGHGPWAGSSSKMSRVVLWLALTGTASCIISGPSLVIGMKPQALQISHRPVAAFIGVNNLNKNFERFLVDFQGEHKSNFNTLTEIGALFIAGFTALSATIIPYTIIKAGHVYGPWYTTTVGVCVGVAMMVTSPVWMKPFRKAHTSSAPVHQMPRLKSSQAAGNPLCY